MDTGISTTPAAERPAQLGMARLDRRRTNRFCTELLVRVCWQDSEGRVFDGSGVIRNISSDGFGLEFNQGLAVDQLVSVRTTKSSFEGVVRNVQQGSKEYLIGVQLLPSSRSSLKGLEMLSKVLKSSERKQPSGKSQLGCDADGF